MKKTIAVLCAAVMLAMLCMTACAQSDDISGSYKLIEMQQDGEDMSSVIDMLGDDGVTLVVEGDKATLTMADSVTDLTVDKEAKTMTAENESSATYTVDGKKITLEDEGTKMVFEKR